MKKDIIFNAALYIRLSCEDGDKEESDSVGNQRKLLIEYIKGKENIELYDVYVDDGFSGTNFNRPAFQGMIKEIEEGRINCVIVKDLSRFGRDYIETGRYLERIFPEIGVRFISIADGIDSIKQTYDMLLPIKNIFNEQYARDISKKIQSVVKAKQKAGDFIGAFTSYGYKKSSVNKNKLMIDEYAANVVRRIFQLYIQGEGKQGISKILNSEGILCPSEYKVRNGEKYRNSKRLKTTSYWTYSTIDKLLKNEIYIGNMVQGKKHQNMRGKQRLTDRADWVIVQGTHEAIIDRQTWDKTQRLLQNRAVKLDFESNVSMFAGFLKCADCGRSMSKVSWNTRKGVAYAYKCGSYRREGKNYCSSHYVRHDVLQDIILDDLRKIVKSVSDLKRIVKEQNFITKKSRMVTEKEVETVREELLKFEDLKKAVYEDYREGLLTKKEFISYKGMYTEKEELCRKQLNVLEGRLKEDVTEDVFTRPWLKRLLELEDIQEIDRSVVVEMIDSIYIYEDNKILIKYNFSNEIEALFSDIYTAKNDRVIGIG